MIGRFGTKMKKKMKTDNGVCLQEEVILSSKKERKAVTLFSFFIELLFVFVISYSAINCFISGYEIEIHKKILFGVIALLCLGLYGCFSLKKGTEIILAGGIFVYGAVGYFMRERIASGFAIIVNVILDKVGIYYGLQLVQYQENSQQPVLDTTIVLLFVAAFFIGILAYLIRNKLTVIGIFLITLPFVFSPEIIGWVPDTKYGILYVLAMFAYVASVSYGKKALWQTNDTNIIQTKVRVILFGLGCILTGILFFSFTQKEYDSLTRDKSLKIVVQEYLTKGFNNLIRGNLYKGAVAGGINFGQLGDVEGVEYNGKVKLRVNIQDEAVGTLHLRGYVGSTYDGRSWDGLSREAEQEKEQLEQKSDIALEEYQSAVIYYMMAYNQMQEKEDKIYYGPAGFDLDAYKRQKIGEEIPFLKPYSSQNARKEIKNISKKFPKNLLALENVLETVTVENVDETYGTIFIPYSVLGNIEEKNGRLSGAEVTDLGKYSWSAPTGQIETTEDILCSFATEENTMPKMFWKMLKEAQSLVEKCTGNSILDYQMGSYEYELTEYQRVINWSDMTNTIRKDISFDELAAVVKNASEFYLQLEDYKYFVEENYTEVPENLKTALLADMSEFSKLLLSFKEKWLANDSISVSESHGADSAIELEELNLSEKVTLVKEYLGANTQYNLKPGKTPSDKDFISYFLFENKQGYCVHYASAATMMFRSMGIPARYVEGYYASPRDVDWGENQKDGSIQLALTDRSAHAWVEIYVEGYGWVPIEVTPGYRDGDTGEENQNNSAITNNTNATPTPTPTPTASPSASKSTAKPVSGQETEANQSAAIFKQYAPVFKWIIAIVCLLGILYVRYFFVWKWRQQKMQAKEYSERMHFYEKQMERLFYWEKWTDKKEDIRETIKKKQINVNCMEEKDWNRLLALYNKNAFSRNGISQEEMEIVSRYYEMLRREIYEKKPFWKKLYYRFIKLA